MKSQFESLDGYLVTNVRCGLMKFYHRARQLSVTVIAARKYGGMHKQPEYFAKCPIQC